jgi:hypothetical protein
MSFYFDDEDDWDVPSSSQRSSQKTKKKRTTEDDFVCENCGGTECYMDGTSGILTCAECFTQSQNIIAASQEELDVTEALGLAGRVKGGAYASIGKSGQKRRTREKKNAEDYDKSEKLPDVVECIRGMQRVLKETSRIICHLADAKDDHERVLETVKLMWKAYLGAWNDGAEYFGAIYPEVRFCFRDSFLSLPIRIKVLKNLTYMSTKRVREEVLQAEQETNSDNEEGDDRDRSVDENASRPEVILPFENDEDEMSQSSDLTVEAGDPKKKSKADALSPIVRMIFNHYKMTRKNVPQVGRRAAALILRPSIAMVVGMLWVAVAPLGVTGGHIREWIGNGSLPLLNAFRLLSSEEQQTLKPIEAFFKPQFPPTLYVMKRIVRALHVACGYKPPKIILRKKKRRFEATTSRQFKPGRLMTAASVPITTARLVSDLGLGQHVLDYSLALMGLPIIIRPGTKTNEEFGKGVVGDPWLPRPLKRARPDRLLDPAKILGVIVIAYKLIPGWQKHSYKRPMSSTKYEGKEGDEASFSSGVDSQAGPKAKRRRTLQFRRRFVPWTQESFRFVGNGRLMEDYLGFLEEEMVAPNDSVLPEFVSGLDSNEKTRTPCAANENSQTALPCRSLRSVTQQSLQYRWTDGLLHYEVTDDPGTDSIGPAPEPLGPLLEYMAFKSGVLPTDILRFVIELDKDMKKKRKKKTSTLKMNLGEAYEKVLGAKTAGDDNSLHV